MLGIKDLQGTLQVLFRTACFCTCQAEGKTDVRHTLVLKHGAPLTSFVNPAWEAHRIYFPVAVYTLSNLHGQKEVSSQLKGNPLIPWQEIPRLFSDVTVFSTFDQKTYSLVSLWFFFCQNPSRWWFSPLYIWGRFQFRLIFFKRGWNHQLAMFDLIFLNSISSHPTFLVPGPGWPNFHLEDRWTRTWPNTSVAWHGDMMISPITDPRDWYFYPHQTHKNQPFM